MGRSRHDLSLKQTRLIGIIGGMGPYAHLDFERKLLEEVHEVFGAIRDQQYPAWLLSSIPATPDRTRALRGEGPDPTPWLLESARRISGPTRADFVVICCHTAHAFIKAMRAQLDVAILDMVAETCLHIASQHREVRRVGILGTTGLLRAGLYQELLAAQGLEAVTLLDLPTQGERWQELLVMESIYGDPSRGEDDGGIKGGGEALERARRRLHLASAKLIDELEAQVIVAACTEIPLALQGPSVHGKPLLDPTRLLARAAIDVAYGRRELPTRHARHAS